MKIAVIGAGITGLLPAYYLSQQGHDVVVYERESYAAMQCSYANGGQLSVSNSEVWNTWSNVIKGAKWLTKKDAPLLINPSLDWAKAKWLFQFLYHTAANTSEQRTIETIALGLESRSLYKEIIAKENLEFDQSDCGILHFYKDQKYFDHAINVQRLYQDAGCEWDILTPKEILHLEPRLSNSKDIIGGAWTPSDWTGDIHKFCLELTKVLQSKYSVKFMFDQVIDDVNEIDADVVIVSGGVGSVKLARTLGDSLPIYPVKGYSITIQLDDESVAPTRSLLDDSAKIVTSTLGNRFRVAGTAELAGENYDIKRSRIDPLLNWVKVNFPTLNRESYSSWACLRPMTPDMMPIVKQGKKRKNVFYHTGHGHLGWTLSPATAKKLLKLIESSI